MASNGIRDRVAIVGMGCTPFGEHWDKGAEDLVVDSSTEALASAGVKLDDVDAFWLGTLGSGVSGLTLSRPLKIDYKPVTRVENMCASGGEALRQAAYAVASGAYDVIVQSLADEHLKDLGPLYRETARLAAPGGAFVIVGYHPHFLMSGVPTHFNSSSGEPVAVESYVHLTSDHVAAARAAGWTLEEMAEGVIDDAWIAKKPKWERFRHHPVSFAMVWRRP